MSNRNQPHLSTYTLVNELYLLDIYVRSIISLVLNLHAHISQPSKISLTGIHLAFRGVMASKLLLRWSPSKEKTKLDYWYTGEQHLGLALCSHACYTDSLCLTKSRSFSFRILIYFGKLRNYLVNVFNENKCI